MTNKTKFQLSTLLVVIVATIIIVLPVSAISKGYSSDDAGLQPGMAVKLSHGGNPESPKVERASKEQTDKLIGVVTTIDQSTLSIGSEGQQIYVETSGEVEAYVSDVNGRVNQGDFLTLSSLNGILAKHNDSSGIVFGLALEDFPSEPSEMHTIDTKEGSKTVGISKIKINLDQKNVQGGQSSQSALARYGEAVVGKQVSELRVAVALLIFIIVFIAEGAILYGAMSSAITSIGRNPMARMYIKHELIKVIVVAMCVLLFGLGSIYLVLWV